MGVVRILEYLLVWFLTGVALLAVLFFARCAMQPSAEQRAAQTQAACHYVPAAEFEIAGHRIKVPADQTTELRFPRGSEVDYLEPTGLTWEKDGILGFCGETLAAQAAPVGVLLLHQAGISALAKLGLSSRNSEAWLGFGTAVRVASLRPPPVDEMASSPDVMIPGDWPKDLKDGDHLATAGWVPPGLRVTTNCIATMAEAPAECNISVQRKSDGMIFEGLALVVPVIPKPGQALPAEVLAVAERLTHLLDQFAVTEQP